MMKKSIALALALLTAAGTSHAGDFSGYYSFEGQKFGFKDVSSNGNDGYFLNSALGQYVLDGRTGAALDKDVLVVGSFPVYQKDMPLTLSVWVRAGAVSVETPLIAKLDPATNQGLLLSVLPGAVRFALNDKTGSGLEVKSNSLPALTGWTHIAVTYSGSGKAAGAKIYINGLLQTTTTVRDALTGNTDTYGPLYIGASLKQPKPLNGQLDEVLIVPRAYSIGQIGCLATRAGDCATADGYGPRGEEGPQGPIGDVGDAGTAGAKGAAGARGPKGATGDTGPAGEAGDRGDVGLAGAQGPRGATGANGLPGKPGADGAKGAAGVKGRTGPDGLQGDPGPQGDAGIAGLTGPAGETGDTGPVGDKGPTGDKGTPGRTGLKGVAGRAGLAGTQGAPGSKGLKGDPGQAGNPGPVGDVGPPGTDYGHLVGSTGAQGPQGPVGYEGPPGQCICRDKYGRGCIFP